MRIVYYILIFFSLAFLHPANHVNAQTCRCVCESSYDEVTESPLACATLCASLGFGVRSCSLINDTPSGSGVTLQDPLGGGVTPEILIGRVIKAALGIVGSLALVMFIYGGFTWMTASGNKEGIEKGKNIIIWATIGLVVIFAAYAMVNFVITKILGVT